MNTTEHRHDLHVKSFAILTLIVTLLLLITGCKRTADPEFGKIVHREKSMYRNILVRDTSDYRCLSFTRQPGMQSCIQKEAPEFLALPYSRGVFAALIANPKAQRVLVIGLGGGVIPSAMRRIAPSMQIDVVELDPAVVDVAKKYFGYREDPLMHTIIGDGRVFVRRQLREGAHYDLIIIDAFERVYVPEHMITQEFIGEVKSLLAPGGMIASNTFSRGPLAPYEAATYQSVFHEIRVMHMLLGSKIILAGRDGFPTDAAIQSNAAALESKFWKIGVFTGELQFHVLPKITGYRPLTDQYSPANLLLEQ